MANMTVVRNNPISRNEVGAVERHDERKNENYTNIDVVLEQAQIICPLGSCDYSPLQMDLIDKFGIHWCILVYENCATA